MGLIAPFSHDPDGFVWAGGIEDTFVAHPHPRSGRGLDEYLLTGHYAHWRADLDRAASLGVRALRYGIPWYRVNPAPGVFDWTWTDPVIAYAATDLGLTLILDLVHYGTPAWLDNGFLNHGYAEAVAAYARAVAERYGDRVRWYTPLNEPLITAEFCGLHGIWPPHLRGDDGFVRILDEVCRGIMATTDALRAVDPTVGIAHVECAALYHGEAGLAADGAAHWQARAWLPGDLLTGRVDAGHPLAAWLEGCGLGPERWAWYAERPFAPDLWGVNYYPEISVHHVAGEDGAAQGRNDDAWTGGLDDLMRATYDRYGVPLFVSETSTHGDDARRSAWLCDSVAAIQRARTDGVPVLGYTWWPLLDLIDWSYGTGDHLVTDFIARLGSPSSGPIVNGPDAFARAMGWDEARAQPLAHYLRRMGLWRLTGDGADGFTRLETSTAAAYRSIIREGITAHVARYAAPIADIGRLDAG